MHMARKEAVGTDIKVSLHTKEDVELWAESNICSSTGNFLLKIIIELRDTNWKTEQFQVQI